MTAFDAFCTAVIAQVRNATKQEKAAIRQELTEHLQDHAAYLTEERGLSPEEAADAAVAAMGDAAEVGRELGKKYPAWPTVIAFLMKLAIVLLIFPLLITLLFYHPVVDNLAARFVPEIVFSHPEETFRNAEQVNYRWTLNGQVFYVYALDTETDTETDGTSNTIAYIWICTYNQNPFLTSAGMSIQQLTFESSTGKPLRGYSSGGRGNSAAFYRCYKITLSKNDPTLVVCLGDNGGGFTVELPLPESEVQP